MIYYLAYGSNLHPMRLNKRCPSAIPLGVVEVNGYQLAFHKKSEDGSGKCDLCERAGATAYGVLYAMEQRDKEALDRAEGLGFDYVAREFKVRYDGGDYTAHSYVAPPERIDLTCRPYDWYKGLVIVGARHHRMPDSYVAWLESVEAIPDPDPLRRSRYEKLLRGTPIA